MSVLGVAVRWLHLVSSVALVGSCAILILGGRSDRATARAWQDQIVGLARASALAAIGSGLAMLMWQTALIEGRPAAAFEPAALGRVALQTQAGVVWLVRHAILLLLATFLAMRLRLATRLDWSAARGETVLLAVLALALLSFSGHAAAVAEGGRAIAFDAVHLLATGVWIGGLWPLASLLRRGATEAGADARPYAVLTARRFSRVALFAVIVLIVTGAANAIVHVGDVAGLLGTPYGRLLLVKLSLFVPLLGLAVINRRVLPAVSGEGATVGRPAMRRLARFVGAEAALAAALLGVVAAMSVTPPALHEESTWPLSFRFSLGPLSTSPAASARALVGSQIAVLGLAGVLASFVAGRLRAPLLAGATVLLAFGAGLALPAIAIDAYPVTYRRPAVPYTASSIARGAALYAQHCAACHGRSGAGDGPAGLALPRPPADLRAPHTAHHTAGDIFWWISHGIAAAGMPGFETRLAQDERWDLVNFVRAIGAAEEARRLGPAIEPERPRIVAPDAAFSVGPAAPRSLKDYRSRRIVLLVLYRLPESRARLVELAQRYGTLVSAEVEVVAVPLDASPDAIRRLGGEPPILFPIVTEGAADIVRTYTMLSAAPRAESPSRAEPAEFLIDRQGYLRAMSAGERRWSDANALFGQIEQLNGEKASVPMASEHAH